MEQKYDLEVGDVVLVAEGGWGLVEDNVGKYVELLKYCDVEERWVVKGYNCELTSHEPDYVIDAVSFGETPMVLLNTKEELKTDAVNSPKHYAVFDGTEAIEIIASSLTQEEFRGYCFGNLLKYRLRCGKKDDVTQELNKADKYKELYEEYKHLCKD